MNANAASGHKVHALLLKMREAIEHYPERMSPVPFEEGVIQGTSFFPGGYGFVRAPDEELPEWPEGKIMVVGNDWGNEVSFSTARDAQSEASGSTWRGIFAAYSRAFDLRDCFFTNAFMGLREGNISSVGECPGRRDNVFKERCRGFLAEQIFEQKPRLIFTLGKYAPDMLSDLAPASSGWNMAKPKWKRIDRFGPLHRGVVFGAIPKHDVTVCALTHPDRAHLNYRHRTYGVYGNELGLIKAALDGMRPAFTTAR